MGIVGRSPASLEKIRQWIGSDSDKIAAHVLDISDARKARALMQDYDVGVIALPDRRSSYKTIETAIGAGLDVVDILEEYHRRPDPYEREGLEVPAGMSLKTSTASRCTEGRETAASPCWTAWALLPACPM